MEQPTLSLIEGFAYKHPIHASKIFDFISVQDLSYILQNIRLDVSAKVLEIISPKTALDLLYLFNHETRLKIIKLVDPSSLISILRFLDSKELEPFIKKLNFYDRARIETQLKYEIDEVGAWMQTNTPQVNSDYTVLETKKYLNENYNNELFSEVFVTNINNSLEGVINLDKILLSDENIKTGSIAKVIKHTLSPRTKLQSAQNHIGFSKYNRLPVISKDNKIMGVFSHVELSHGLKHGRVTGITIEDEVAEGYGVYGDTLLNLLNIK